MSVGKAAGDVSEIWFMMVARSEIKPSYCRFSRPKRVEFVSARCRGILRLWLAKRLRGPGRVMLNALKLWSVSQSREHDCFRKNFLSAPSLVSHTALVSLLLRFWHRRSCWPTEYSLINAWTARSVTRQRSLSQPYHLHRTEWFCSWQNAAGDRRFLLFSNIARWLIDWHCCHSFARKP